MLSALPVLLAQEIDPTQLDEAFQTDGIDAWDWGRAAIIMGVAIAIAFGVRWIVARIINRTDDAGFAAQLVGRLAAYLVLAAGLIYSLSALGVRVGPLLGALGIVGIALAFALKDILENFVAGIILQIRRPFRRGDQIVTGEHEGRVVEVNSRSVVIDQPDGTRVVVPSSSLITKPIVNLTSTGARRTTLEIGIGYASELDEAVGVVHHILAQAPSVMAVPPPEAYVSEFGDNAVIVAARFWHAPEIADMWRARHEVAVAAKRALDDAGIEIAFPQRVVWLRQGDDPASDR